MPEAIVTELLKLGPMGALLVSLAYALYKMAVKYDELQVKRVLDVQQYAAQLLEANSKIVSAVSSVPVSLDSTKVTVSELKDEVRRLQERVH